MNEYYLYNGKLFSSSQLQEKYGEVDNEFLLSKGLSPAYEYKGKLFSQQQLQEKYGDQWESSISNKGINLYSPKESAQASEVTAQREGVTPQQMAVGVPESIETGDEKFWSNMSNAWSAGRTQADIANSMDILMTGTKPSVGYGPSGFGVQSQYQTAKLTEKDKERYRQRVADGVKKLEEIPTSKAKDQLGYIMSNETASQGQKTSAMMQLVAAHPSLLADIMVESAASGPEALALSIAGGLGGPIGVAAGSFIGSLGVEAKMSIIEGMSQGGYDFRNPNDVKDFLKDEDAIKNVRSFATRRGIAIAGVDALFSMLGAKMVKGGGGFVKKAAATGIDASGGGVGEGVAQLATTGELDLPEVLLETIVELPVAGGELASVAVSNKPETASTKDIEQATLPEDVMEQDKVKEATRDVDEIAREINNESSIIVDVGNFDIESDFIPDLDLSDMTIEELAAAARGEKKGWDALFRVIKNSSVRINNRKTAIASAVRQKLAEFFENHPLFGKISKEDVYDPVTDQKIISSGDVIGEDHIRRLLTTSIEKVEVNEPREVNNNKQKQSPVPEGEVLEGDVQTEPESEVPSGEVDQEIKEGALSEMFSYEEIDSMMEVAEAVGDTERIKELQDAKDQKKLKEKQAREERKLQRRNAKYEKAKQKANEERRKDLEESLGITREEEVLEESESTLPRVEQEEQVYNLEEDQAKTQAELDALDNIGDVDKNAIGEPIVSSSDKTENTTRGKIGQYAADFFESWANMIDSVAGRNDDMAAWLQGNLINPISKAAGTIALKGNDFSVRFRPYEKLLRKGKINDKKVYAWLVMNEKTKASRESKLRELQVAMKNAEINNNAEARKAWRPEKRKKKLNAGLEEANSEIARLLKNEEAEISLTQEERKYAEFLLNEVSLDGREWLDIMRQTQDKDPTMHDDYFGKSVSGNFKSDADESIGNIDPTNFMGNDDVRGSTSKREEGRKGATKETIYVVDASKAALRTIQDQRADIEIAKLVRHYKQVFTDPKFIEKMGGQNSELYRSMLNRAQGALDKITNRNRNQIGNFIKQATRFHNKAKQMQLATGVQYLKQAVPTMLASLNTIATDPVAFAKAWRDLLTLPPEKLREAMPGTFLARKETLDFAGDLGSSAKTLASMPLNLGDYHASKLQTILEYYRIARKSDKSADLRKYAKGEQEIDQRAARLAQLIQEASQSSNTLAAGASQYRNPEAYTGLVLPYSMMNFNMASHILGGIKAAVTGDKRGKLTNARRRRIVGYSMSNLVHYIGVSATMLAVSKAVGATMMGEELPDEENIFHEDFDWNGLIERATIMSTHQASGLSQVPGVGDAFDWAFENFVVKSILGDEFDEKKHKVNYKGDNAQALGIMVDQVLYMHDSTEKLYEIFAEKGGFENMSEDERKAFKFHASRMLDSGLVMFGGYMKGGNMEALSASVPILREMFGAIKKGGKEFAKDYEKTKDMSPSQKSGYYKRKRARSTPKYKRAQKEKKRRQERRGD